MAMNTQRFVAVAMLLFLAAVRADPVTYQGELRLQGQPFTGTAQMKFVIVDGQTGLVLWSNDGQTPGQPPVQPAAAVSVAVEDGLFAVDLGAPVPNMAAIPAGAFMSTQSAVLRLWVRTTGQFEQFTDQPIYAGVFGHQANAVRQVDPMATNFFAIWDGFRLSRSSLIREVGGNVELASGGIKYPDNSLQTTAPGKWAMSGPNTVLTMGNVGIGTASPNANLHVNNPGFGDARLLLENSTRPDFDQSVHFKDSTSEWFIGNSWSPTNPDGFGIGRTSEKLDFVIHPTGHVGLRTPIPLAPLHITSTEGDARLLLHMPNGSQGDQAVHFKDATSDWYIGNLWRAESIDGFGIGRTNAKTDFTIDNQGRVGIGTLVPGFRLDVAGELAIHGQRIIDDTGRWVGPGIRPSGLAGGDLEGSYPFPSLADEAVETDEIMDNAVTTAKIATNAVTSEKIFSVPWSKVTGAPSTLPPSGPAGGTLAGLYPNPSLAPASVGSAALATDASSLNRVSGGAMNSSAGEIGIGTSSPTERLHVVGAARATNSFLIAAATNQIRASVGADSSGAGLVQTLSSSGGSQRTEVGSTPQSSGGGGTLASYSATGIRIAGTGHVTGAPSRGVVAVFNPAGTAWVGSMIVNSSGTCDLVVNGLKNFRVPHPSDQARDIVYTCPEAPEVQVTHRGIASLRDGQCEVVMPDYFSLVCSPTAPVTVLLTPMSADSRGLAVVEQTHTAFRVQELLSGTGTYSFSFQVIGIRRGYEGHQPVQPRNAVSITVGSESSGIDR